jgi:hypothetical protein
LIIIPAYYSLFLSSYGFEIWGILLSFISASHTHSRDSFDLIICISKVFSMILWLLGM